MKKIQKTLRTYNAMRILFPLLFSLGAYAQQDTILQQRSARKLVREGNTLHQQKEYAAAAVTYQKALEKSPTYYKAAHNLGNALAIQKNTKEALSQYELALKGAKTKKEKAASYHNIGNVYLQEKAYDKAIDAFKNSLRANPLDDETRYNLAHAKKMLQKQKEEEQKNKQEPPSAYAKRMKKKADALVSKFKFEEASELMNKALEKDMTVTNYKDFMKKLDDVIEIKK
jgi:Ca-activated chloride channel family protein